MARDGYVTLEDLACRWTTAEVARAEFAKDLNRPSHLNRGTRWFFVEGVSQAFFVEVKNSFLDTDGLSASVMVKTGLTTRIPVSQRCGCIKHSSKPNHIFQTGTASGTTIPGAGTRTSSSHLMLYSVGLFS